MRHLPGFGRDPRENRPADGAGDAEFLVDAFDPVRAGANGIENAFGKDVGFAAVRVTREEEKLLAAPANDRVGKAGGGVDAARHLPQDLIADAVSELVVDSLKVVDIHEIKDEVTIAHVGGGMVGKGTQSLTHVSFDGAVEEAAVANAGEQVGQGSF